MIDGREVAEMLRRLESGADDDPLRGHYGVIYGEVKKVAGLNHDDVLDLFQEVLLAILEKRLFRFDPSRGLLFRNWLRGVARFEAIDKIRNRLGRQGQRKGRERQFQADWEEFDVRDHREGDNPAEARDSVWNALRHVNAESKTILKAYYGIDEPPATLREIGVRFGVSESLIWIKYHQSLDRIRRFSEAT